MARLYAARGAQPLLMSEFVANYNDTMVNTSGALATFGSTYTDTSTFDIINLPPGAIISHGEMIVDTTFVGSTASAITIGDSGSATRYLGSTSLLLVSAGAKYPFTMNVASGTNSAVSATGAYTGLNIRIAITHTVANQTGGKLRIRVYWSLEGKVNETYPQ